MTSISAARLRDIEASLWFDSAREWSEVNAQVQDVQAQNAARPVGAFESTAEIAALAERRAGLMMDVVAGAPAGCLEGLRDWLQERVNGLEGGRLRIARGAAADQARRGLLGRVTCRDWWRRALTRAATAKREAEGRAAGRVWAGGDQYITTETMRRKLNRDAQNAAMLAATELENEDGQVFTLAELSAVSVSNPGIRRGELMTRIRGCEEWAEAHGMAAVFTTQTAPGRFHARHHHGSVNQKWVEAGRPTPKDAQRWLCEAWKLARSALDRRGVRFFGFRVAEPHHDGTPHWHGLFWCEPEHIETLTSTIREYWLRDDGNAPGAQERRVLFKPMEKGGASGYIAKYIAKGIDDAGAVGLEGHDDEIDGRTVRMDQGDLFGGGAARVRAWASAHGIRQFQPVGQPPVTVWRELRRVPKEQAGAASERVQAMWQAAQREGEKRASWSVYLLRQGGPLVGRDYKVAVEREDRLHEGRYEAISKPCPVGVVDRLQGSKAYSNRKEWRPRGAWGSRVNGLGTGERPSQGSGQLSRHRPMGDAVRSPAVHPWTRVNNCTAETIAGVPVGVIKRGAGRLQTWAEVLRDQESVMREGQNHMDTGGEVPPWRVSRPPQGSGACIFAGLRSYRGQGSTEN